MMMHGCVCVCCSFLISQLPCPPAPLSVSFFRLTYILIYIPRFSAFPPPRNFHTRCVMWWRQNQRKILQLSRVMFFFSFFLVFCVCCFEFQRLLVLSAPRNSRRLNVIVVVGGGLLLVLLLVWPMVFLLLLLLLFLLLLSLLQPPVSAHEWTLSSGNSNSNNNNNSNTQREKLQCTEEKLIYIWLQFLKNITRLQNLKSS